jgi:hypothetical protein
MQVQINLKSHAESQVGHLVALLRSLDFVENIKVQPDLPIVSKNATQSRFDKYSGIWKNKVTTNEIDEQLNLLRNEWERSF